MNRSTLMKLFAVLLLAPCAAQATPISLSEQLERDGYTILLTALQVTGLEEAVNETELTLFAPTNAAFMALGLNEAILLELDPGNPDDLVALTRLRDILLDHVASGASLFQELIGASPIETVSGNSLNVDRGAPMSGIPTVFSGNVLTTNGILHRIDAVILGDEDEARQVIVAVAEPSTVALALLALTFILVAGRRRRSSIRN